MGPGNRQKRPAVTHVCHRRTTLTSLWPGPIAAGLSPQLCGATTDLETERASEVLSPGVATIEHVEHHATAAPDVHLGIAGLSHDHFRCHVGLRARNVVPWEHRARSRIIMNSVPTLIPGLPQVKCFKLQVIMLLLCGCMHGHMCHGALMEVRG